MNAEIWSGIFTLAGVIITVAVGNSKTIYRIEQLEKKQDKHNAVIERMYILEEKASETNRRLNILEKKNERL